MFPTHLKHKEHRQHHHRHVMMPALPQSKLVIPQPNLALGIAQRLFDPESLSLLIGKTLARCRFRRIAEAIFDLLGRSYLVLWDLALQHRINKSAT